VLFALIEVILFAWVFGMDRAWTELHLGSDITIPKIYRLIIKFITPVFLIVILGAWLLKDGIPKLLLLEYWPKAAPGFLRNAYAGYLARNSPATSVIYPLVTRLAMVAMFAVLSYMVWHKWRGRDMAKPVEVTQ